jgi:hypothetical protein
MIVRWKIANEFPSKSSGLTGDNNMGFTGGHLRKTKSTPCQVSHDLAHIPTKYKANTDMDLTSNGWHFDLLTLPVSSLGE